MSSISSSLLFGLLFSTAVVAKPPATDKTEKVQAKTIALGMHSDLPTLTVKIQGIEGSLVIDTGAETTFFNLEEAGRMKVKLGEEKFSIQGIAGEEGDMVVGSVEATVSGLDAGAFPSLPGKHLFSKMKFAAGEHSPLGVIGLEQLRDAKAIIDFEKATLTAGSGEPYAGPQGWPQLTLAPQIFNTRNRVVWGVPAKIGDQSGIMIVDSGAMFTVLSKDFAKRAKVELHASNHTANSGAGGGSTGMEIGAIPDLVLGDGFHLGKVEVAVMDAAVFKNPAKNAQGEEVPFIGMLSIDQLRRIKGKLDCGQGKLYVTPDPLGEVATLDAIDMGALIHAVYALAAAGDKEAKICLESLQAGENLPVGPAQAQAMIERQKAREKAAKEKE